MPQCPGGASCRGCWACIHQENLVPKNNDAGHTRPFRVPAIAFATMNDGKIFPGQINKWQPKWRQVMFIGAQVEVYSFRFAIILDFICIEGKPLNVHFVLYLDWPVLHGTFGKDVFGRRNVAVAKKPFDGINFFCQLFIHARCQYLFFRHQPIIAPVDVLDLGIDVFFQPDQYRPGFMAIFFLACIHALEIEHLHHGKFREVGHLAILQKCIRKQQGIRPGLQIALPGFYFSDQPSLSQMLYRIGRATATYKKPGLGNADPGDAGRYVFPFDLAHAHQSITQAQINHLLRFVFMAPIGRLVSFPDFL